jgi:uncharacterized protein involved in exopolysaccharide biosynthesis
VAVLEDRYYEIHRHARAIRAKLASLGRGAPQASQEELSQARVQLEQAESQKRAILQKIDEIEDHLLTDSTA